MIKRSTKVEGGGNLYAKAELVKLKGNARPYFTVTGSLTDGQRHTIASGMLHAEIAAAFPDLIPLIALHLSDDDGTPLHMMANGMYWLGSTNYQKYNRDLVVRHFRVTEVEADTIHKYVEECGYAEEALRYMVSILHLRERWLVEATEALMMLGETAP